MVKIAFFYEYILLPPRWVVYLEISKYKLPKAENYTYGETPYITMYKIIRDVGSVVDIGGRFFVDLGCGVGKTVFTAKIMFNLKSIGVDNISTFIQKANRIKNLLGKLVVSAQDLEFIKADIEEYLSDQFDKICKERMFIYIPSTAFEEDFFCRIVEKIVSKAYNCLIVTLSKSIPKSIRQLALSSNKTLILLFSRSYYFSWGRNRVYAYYLFQQAESNR
ncbi:MAG: methyltransferase domain-containing protein [bacterium]